MTHYLPHALAVVFFLLFLRLSGKAKESRAQVEELADVLRERVKQSQGLVGTCEQLTGALNRATVVADAAVARGALLEADRRDAAAMIAALRLRQDVVAELLRRGAFVEAAEILADPGF